MLRVYLAIAASLIFWSNAFIMIEIALRELAPVELILLRFIPLAALLTAYMALFMRERILEILRRHSGRLILISLLNVPVYSWLVFEGQKRVSPSLAALIVGCAPLFTYLFSIALNQEIWRPRKAFGLAFAFAGLYLAVFHGSPMRMQASDFIHAGMVMAGAIATSYATVHAKIFLKENGHLEMMLLMIPIGALPMIFLIPPALMAKLPTLSVNAWASVAFLALASTAAGSFTWFYALKRIPASNLLVFINAMPFLTMLFSYIFLGKPVTVWLALGGVLIALGIVTTSRA